MGQDTTLIMFYLQKCKTLLKHKEAKFYRVNFGGRNIVRGRQVDRILLFYFSTSLATKKLLQRLRKHMIGA